MKFDPESVILWQSSIIHVPASASCYNDTARIAERKNKSSDNDASEMDILGHFETYWDNSKNCLKHIDCFPSHFRPFYPVLGSFKRTRSGATDQRTHGPTDAYRDAWTHLICIRMQTSIRPLVWYRQRFPCYYMRTFKLLRLRRSNLDRNTVDGKVGNQVSTALWINIV